ncbi:hypothetical protein AVEN_146911-1 [Araneus ventricosus]|uniref:Uncharacterized protein n=1 Tax=Araneus ventricosus TaxID=182803 RepID=A0A4Y2P078_ARAVE|nr:hypothetical protein AVEN_146911-1 [Araneus ventricosus]
MVQYLLEDHPQIAILVCSKVAASLTRQESKLETSYCKRRSHHASNLQKACCVKLIANYSKNRVRRRTSDSKPANPLPKPAALATEPAGPRLRQTDCANTSRIYTFYFKLSS